MAVSIPDGLRLHAWRIVGETSPRAYIVLAETAEEALACWRVGYKAAHSEGVTVPAAVDVVRVGVYLWPRCSQDSGFRLQDSARGWGMKCAALIAGLFMLAMFGGPLWECFALWIDDFRRGGGRG